MAGKKTSKRNRVKISKSTILTYIYTLFGDPSVDLLSKTSPHPADLFDWVLTKKLIYDTPFSQSL